MLECARACAEDGHTAMQSWTTAKLVAEVDAIIEELASTRQALDGAVAGLNAAHAKIAELRADGNILAEYVLGVRPPAANPIMSAAIVLSADAVARRLLTKSHPGDAA